MTASPGVPTVAAIEAGGTKVVVAAGGTWEEIHSGDKHTVPTGRPEDTLAAAAEWLRARRPEGVAAVGVAAFGPLDLTAGRVGPTPKPGWAGFDWRAVMERHFPGASIGIDTDTNGAALAESRWGAAAGLDVVLYITVGTGIGAGVVVSGQMLHGLVHPEVGHMRIPRDSGDPFPGTCPFHGDCLEGLAAGPAVAARWGTPGARLPPDHPAWALESRYLSAAVVNLTLALSPQVVVMGGGVMAVPGLLESVRSGVRDLMAGYLDVPELGDGIGDYLVAPGLGPDSGVVGAFAIGQAALHRPGRG